MTPSSRCYGKYMRFAFIQCGRVVQPFCKFVGSQICRLAYELRGLAMSFLKRIIIRSFQPDEADDMGGS